MTTKDLDAIMDKLTSNREQKKQIALTKAQAEIQTIQRETDAISFIITRVKQTIDLLVFMAMP